MCLCVSSQSLLVYQCFSSLESRNCQGEGGRSAAQPQGPRLLRSSGSSQRRNSPAECVCVHTAGPKLRKWYGEGERGAAVAQPARPGADGGGAQSVQRTAVLVTDADNATGEQVVLQLILARRGRTALQGLCQGVAEHSHSPLLLCPVRFAAWTI